MPRPKWLKKATHLVQKVALEVLENTTETEILAVTDPFEIVELLGAKLPSAALKVAKEEVRQERRRPIPADVKRAVLARDGHACVVCKSKAPLHLHHYIHVANGGENTTGNLVTLCANHHYLVHAGNTPLKKPCTVPLLPTPKPHKP